MTEKMNVVSFSGGRTSARLVYLMEEKRRAEGIPVTYIFMDTGAEHPATYDFVKAVAKDAGIDLVCLRAQTREEGKGNTYRVIGIDEIGNDLQPWRDMLEKYSTPYNPGGAFCTDRMKLKPFTRYCQERFPDGYITWLGIRSDEPRRLTDRPGVKYLAHIDGSDKLDILAWWASRPFDLQIPEWLGNCVFCIKKGVNKVQLAAMDEPDLAAQFLSVLEEPTVRTEVPRASPHTEMYRGRLSFRSIIASTGDLDRDHLLASMRGRVDTNSCSESCEVFGEQTAFKFNEED